MGVVTSRCGAGGDERADDVGFACEDGERRAGYAATALVPGEGFAWAPNVRFGPDAKVRLFRSAGVAEGAVPEVARRRVEGSAGGGLTWCDAMGVVAARRAYVGGGLPRRELAGAGVEAVCAIAAGVAAGGAGAAAVAGAADGALRNALPCSARLARVVKAFGGAFRSTGLVILSVIRAMGEGRMRLAASASHHSGPDVLRRRAALGHPLDVCRMTSFVRRWRRTNEEFGATNDPVTGSGCKSALPNRCTARQLAGRSFRVKRRAPVGRSESGSSVRGTRSSSPAYHFLRFFDGRECRVPGDDVVVPAPFITVEGSSLARISDRGDLLGIRNRNLASPPIALCNSRRLALLRLTMRRTTCSA